MLGRGAYKEYSSAPGGQNELFPIRVTRTQLGQHFIDAGPQRRDLVFQGCHASTFVVPRRFSCTGLRDAHIGSLARFGSLDSVRHAAPDRICDSA